MIDPTSISKLRALDIEQVAMRLGLVVKRHTSLCPFHNDSRPSLTYSRKANTYHCFVCGAHGGPIDLVMHRLHKGFVEACRWLADDSNIIVDTYRSHKVRLEPEPRVDVRHLSMLVAQPYLCDEARHFLYDERRLRPEVIQRLGITSIASPVPMSGDMHGGWFNAPSLLIPYRDVDGRLLSVQARYLGTDPTKPRFQFPKGSRCGIYNLPALQSLQPDAQVFITEGVSDCLALLSAGFTAIAIPSATLLKPDEVKLLSTLHSQHSTIYHMYPDRDAPGERLYLDLKALLSPRPGGVGGGLLVRHQLPEGFKDIGQFYAHVRSKDQQQ